MLTEIPLDEACSIHQTTAPEALCPTGSRFEAWWELRPSAPDRLVLYGREIPLPRLQRAYGRDYRFSGQTSRAHEIPELMQPCLSWARQIDPRLNGLLLNWYDAAEAHRIGPHRDSNVDRVEGSPIVTISFGASRTFRMRPHGGRGKRDLEVSHGTVLVIPWETNQRWTHEVPHFARDRGLRISLTARAFTEA